MVFLFYFIGCIISYFLMLKSNRKNGLIHIIYFFISWVGVIMAMIILLMSFEYSIKFKQSIIPFRLYSLFRIKPNNESRSKIYHLVIDRLIKCKKSVGCGMCSHIKSITGYNVITKELFPELFELKCKSESKKYKDVYWYSNSRNGDRKRIQLLRESISMINKKKNEKHN